MPAFPDLGEVQRVVGAVFTESADLGEALGVAAVARLRRADSARSRKL